MSYGSTLLAKGASLLYGLDEPNGSTIADDQGGADNDGVIAAGPGTLPTFGVASPIPGRTAAQFDGSDDRLRSEANVTTGTDWSFVFSILFPAGATGSRYIAHVGSGVSDYHPLLASSKSGSTFIIEAYGSGAQSSTSNIFAADTWYRITFTYTQTSPGVGTLKIYNGDTLLLTNTSFPITGITHLLTLGGVQSFANNDGMFSMQDFAMFPTALSLTDVQDLEAAWQDDINPAEPRASALARIYLGRVVSGDEKSGNRGRMRL